MRTGRVGDFSRAIHSWWCRSPSPWPWSRPPGFSFEALGKRLRSKRDSGPGMRSSSKSMRAWGASIRSGRRIFTASSAKNFRRFRESSTPASRPRFLSGPTRCGGQCFALASIRRPRRNRRPRRRERVSLRSGTASARIISQRWDCRCFAAALSPRPKRPSPADQLSRSSTKSWRKNCGRTGMHSVNKFSFRC